MKSQITGPCLHATHLCSASSAASSTASKGSAVIANTPSQDNRIAAQPTLQTSEQPKVVKRSTPKPQKVINHLLKVLPQNALNGPVILQHEINTLQPFERKRAVKQLAKDIATSTRLTHEKKELACNKIHDEFPTFETMRFARPRSAQQTFLKPQKSEHAVRPLPEQAAPGTPVSSQTAPLPTAISSQSTISSEKEPGKQVYQLLRTLRKDSAAWEKELQSIKTLSPAEVEKFHHRITTKIANATDLTPEQKQAAAKKVHQVLFESSTLPETSMQNLAPSSSTENTHKWTQ